MKRFFNKSEKSSLYSFEALTANEMMKVRGGGDTRPATREKDILEPPVRPKEKQN